jgi:hypothetical protein
MKQQVIDSNYLPANPVKVILFGALVWLYLDRFQASGWVQGTAWTLLVLLFIGSIIQTRNEQKSIPIFKEKTDD